MMKNKRLAEGITSACKYMERADEDAQASATLESAPASDRMTGLALLAIEARLAALAELLIAWTEIAGDDL